MDSETKDRPKVVATKLPPEYLPGLDVIAEIRSETRSALLRELVVALLDGRVILPISERNQMPVREFATSKVGRAALDYAQRVAEEAVETSSDTQKIVAEAPEIDLYAVVVRAARLLSEGR